MKINFSLKDPDGVDWAAEELRTQLTEAGDLNEDEIDDAVEAFCDKFKYREYCNLEYDTETGSVAVRG